jgi:hypothetical protein
VSGGTGGSRRAAVTGLSGSSEGRGAGAREGAAHSPGGDRGYRVSARYAPIRFNGPGSRVRPGVARTLVRVTEAVLDPEDQKIITLARSSRARVAASEGAAVRDETGRTYTAAAVALPSLQLSALRLAVAMAVSSGAVRLEAAALVSDAAEPDPGDLAAVRDLGPDAPVFHAAPDGTLRATLVP